MTVVVDASVLVAALVDDGPDGRWVADELINATLAAPHLVLAESANVLRRASRSGEISEDAGALAHADLNALPIDLYPYQPFAERVWELRHNLTAYDAWHVALAEELGSEFITLDRRIAGAPGLRCEFRVPAA